MEPCYVLFLQVEPNTKLFPAVFVLPSSQNMIQFELGKLKVSHKESVQYICATAQNQDYNYPYQPSCNCIL